MADEQKIVISEKFNFEDKNRISTIDLPSERAFSIVKFNVDASKGSTFSNEPEASFINVRNDLVDSLNQAKQILNNYDIPFTCDYFDVSLENKDIDDLQRLGICVSLNTRAGFNKESSYSDDDYYVGPGFNNSLVVYGAARRDINIYKNNFEPKKTIYKIYDIRNTYGIDKPEIINLYKNFINISRIFFSLGFYQLKPKAAFFKSSIPEDSNWNKFYKTIPIKDGQSYKELLKQIYSKKNSVIWSQPDKYWNGSKFDA